MIIVTREGEESGKVAAVVIDPDQQTVTHLLLARPQRAPDYRLVPVELIEQVSAEKVWLAIGREKIATLPERR
jgi:sporulation protein YlmC with PRC-barrel domain